MKKMKASVPKADDEHQMTHLPVLDFEQVLQ